MKPTFRSGWTLLVLSLSLTLSSCYLEDPGPVQEVEKEFTFVDFDRLEMGDAFHVTVEKSNFFSIRARGDRRNIDDLDARKEGGTLIIRFDENRSRRHDTFITITLPVLASAHVSGTSNVRITGFVDQEALEIYLSGASVCQADIQSAYLNTVVSGSSHLSLYGSADSFQANVSGASVLKAFALPAESATISASGSSQAFVSVHDHLHASASGSSVIIYRGSPSVTKEVSGNSMIRQE